jgi:hypothetical protein
MRTVELWIACLLTTTDFHLHVLPCSLLLFMQAARSGGLRLTAVLCFQLEVCFAAAVSAIHKMTKQLTI